MKVSPERPGGVTIAVLRGVTAGNRWPTRLGWTQHITDPLTGVPGRQTAPGSQQQGQAGIVLLWDRSQALG